MDIDSLLIKLVRQRPILYKKFDEINHRDIRVAWKEISFIIGKKESWAQGRWYSIVQQFKKELIIFQSTKRQSKYKFFDKLFFLVKHIDFKTLNKNHNDQREEVNLDLIEFVITDAQLEDMDESTDSEGNIFEELDEENHLVDVETTNEETPKIESCQNEIGYEEDYKTLELYEIENELVGETTNELFVGNVVQKSNVKYEDNIELSDKEIEIIKEFDVITNNQNESVVIPRNKMIAESTVLENNPGIPNKAQSKKNLKKSQEFEFKREESRCEDTIFAELVGVMLKKMDPVKKKNAKREIMNILLS